MAELSKRYATALFELAIENGLLDDYIEQLLFLRTTLQADDCRNIIEHPQISTADKRNFFKNVFEGNIHNDLMSFLYLVVSKNREHFLLPIIDAFIDLSKKHKGQTTAELVSATQLDEPQLLKIKELLAKKLEKQVEVVSRVDSSLIGGFCIYVDGYFVDCTIRKQLNEMVDFIKRSAPNDSET